MIEEAASQHAESDYAPTADRSPYDEMPDAVPSLQDNLPTVETWMDVGCPLQAFPSREWEVK